MKKLTIAFDIDGVLRDLVGYTLSKMDPPRSPDELQAYGDFVKLFRGKEEWRSFVDGSGAWFNAMPHGAMREIFYDLSSRHVCIIVTSNSHPIGQLATIDWIRTSLTKKPLDIHFVNDKTRVHFDAIVEDMPMNAIKAAKKGRLAFLVKRPWSFIPEGNRKNRSWAPRLVSLPEDEVAGPVMVRELEYWQRFAKEKKS